MCKRLLFVLFLTMAGAVVSAQAQDVDWIRAAYWDDSYPTSWAGDGVAMRDALQAAGYEVLNADQLKTWMDARIADKAYSVVVFCRDIAPDTVAESMSPSCTLRRYLNAGGKIVWYADIPFYNVGHADGTRDTWGDSGAPGILGFNTSSAPRDSGNTVTITADGARWGLTQTWSSQRPAAPAVTDPLTILAVDNAGNAAAWVKPYVANDKFRGFVRLFDTGGAPDVSDVIALAEYTSFRASEPTPADGAMGVTQPLLMWEPGTSAVWHDLYFGTDPEPPYVDHVAWPVYPLMSGLEPGTTYYWRVDEVEADGVTTYPGDVWSFSVAPLTAYDPVPRDGDKWIDVNTSLNWQPGMAAVKRDLYLGTDAEAVANRDAGVFVGNIANLSYQPDTLQQETTYYWAVDEYDTSTMHAGTVWSFTTAGPAGGGVKAEYFNNMAVSGAPALTRTDPQIDFNWGDAGPGDPIGVDGFSARWTADLEIAAADTYTFITTSDDGARLWLNDQLIVDQWVDQGPTDAFSAPIYLEPGFYPLRMEYYENGGGAMAQLSWQTPRLARQIIPGGPLQPPVRARALYPQNGDVNVPQDLTLTWSAGENAAQHQVYLGDDKDAVANATPATAGIYRGQQGLDETGYTVGNLQWNHTYYWRIDEVNNADPESPWQGGVWSFTTADFIIVDDFESYTNDVGNRVFQTWIDGLGFSEPAPGNPGNGTGAIVGHDIWSADSPYFEGQIVETGNVEGGAQAMPVYYDNSATPYLSEAQRTWTTPQNWTLNGVTDLSLWFHGNPAGFVQNGPDSFTMSAAGADIWGTADEFRFAYKSLSGDGSIVARVDSVENTNDWAKAGVMIREGLDAGAKHAMVVVTPTQGVQFTWREFANADMTEHSTQGGLAPPYWVKLTRSGNTFTAERSEDGINWVPITDADGSSREITMVGNVYIGLAFTSHNANAVGVAEFSGVKTSGGVSGAWQIAEIGVDHPENDVADTYVRLEDAVGGSATVLYPNGATVRDWTQWNIPLADFAGVSLNAVKKMTLGIGNPDVPAADGTGVVYYDDIRVVKPAPVEEPNEVATD